MVSKYLQFSVDSQLMGELGEKLVTKNYIALSELIKNSYDADAKKVTGAFLTLSAMKGNAESVGLIPDLHKKEQYRGMTCEVDGIFPAGPVHLIAPFPLVLGN